MLSRKTRAETSVVTAPPAYNFGISAGDLLMEWRKLEARVRIELTYKGFADLSLTTWVPRPKEIN
jgi:hypothetical protein